MFRKLAVLFLEMVEAELRASHLQPSQPDGAALSCVACAPVEAAWLCAPIAQIPEGFRQKCDVCETSILDRHWACTVAGCEWEERISLVFPPTTNARGEVWHEFVAVIPREGKYCGQPCAVCNADGEGEEDEAPPAVFEEGELGCFCDTDRHLPTNDVPFEGVWISCDVCGRWCHGECAGMDKQQAEETEEYTLARPRPSAQAAPSSPLRKKAGLRQCRNGPACKEARARERSGQPYHEPPRVRSRPSERAAASEPSAMEARVHRPGELHGLSGLCVAAKCGYYQLQFANGRQAHFRGRELPQREAACAAGAAAAVKEEVRGEHTRKRKPTQLYDGGGGQGVAYVPPEPSGGGNVSRSRIAYGSDGLQLGGHTNLHCDVSDAVNVMVDVYEGDDGDDSEDETDEARAAPRAGEESLMSAIWDIYRWQDTEAILQLLHAVARERDVEITSNPIHDQLFYLDDTLRKRLRDQYKVRGWRFVQRRGDAVFIPAGCPHQVRNLSSCVKVALDFVSPENAHRCVHLTDEFAKLPRGHHLSEDKLQFLL
ncbi:hypothetical protein EMIHUDRAFT_222108 [Emiliania huxleyi CCMP1516]|uniref:JmjC domain-containing protein n=2 Tax=Emiliania huxleyi TaxID=2903 RepID=A0A0D3KZ59_EMIH1|nr:hypothetical protein EMIHUDRAFT_222108 [Emiliania huxleyi CCMP1516]EOD41044.1 hypothetical protein EMIHUDRAFT_222108 [Emiliania huxleyi CCMP1516]|eukprot:XP_005793473.1 hypothetical protein EMIHUDRAFT_222108 [Emiliania huxleyi CCMP1516]